MKGKRNVIEWCKYLLKYIWIKIKEEYKFKKPITKSKITEISIFTSLIIIIGILVHILVDAGKDVFFNNFDKQFNNIAILSLVLFTFLIVFLGCIISSKYKAILPYVFSAEMIYLSFFTNCKYCLIIFTLLLLPLIWNYLPKLNIWLLIMIITSLCLLITGFSVIDNLYGNKNGQIFFYNCSDGKMTEIYMNCSSNIKGELIANDFTQCYLNKEFSSIKGDIKFHLANTTIISEEIKDSIEFLPPQNLAMITILFNASTAQNETVCLRTNWHVRFPIYEEAKADKEKFTAYVIALLGIVVFTVPSFTLNCIKIWREGKK